MAALVKTRDRMPLAFAAWLVGVTDSLRARPLSLFAAVLYGGV